MDGFEVKSETERFIVVCPRCRQNLKFGHFNHVVVLTSTGEKCSKMRAALAARSFLPLLTNNVTAFWRCLCRSRRRLLNSIWAPPSKYCTCTSKKIKGVEYSQERVKTTCSLSRLEFGEGVDRTERF